MNNKPITDKNINFGQAKIIETNEHKTLKSCAMNVTRVLDQHGAEIVPVIELSGNQIIPKIRYQLKKRT